MKKPKKNTKPMINAAANVFECDGCGKKLPILIPTDMATFAKNCEKWATDHAPCFKKKK